MSVLHVLHFYSLHQENPPPLVRTSFHKISDVILVKCDLFWLLVQSNALGYSLSSSWKFSSAIVFNLDGYLNIVERMVHTHFLVMPRDESGCAVFLFV
jgi:hypothetical protein